MGIRFKYICQICDKDLSNIPFYVTNELPICADCKILKRTREDFKPKKRSVWDFFKKLKMF